ncbi:uncharacterized protein EDB93DRAFT_1086768 [Suillus bovinus]|uniref:uncharacterized protein n=1 Tax=Suillus bovinus TaxID=48563 RepID=UPI001B8659DD|nr:uncharacterized protein EDB93DRAFT_1086768 [Suillus bovinus]KAG2146041.1 hypothetical protein EDB93DRAFT_1086768 [Suillus bovinus]
MVRAAAHSLAHRGPPTTTTTHSHTRVRWQPYYATLSSVSSRQSPSYLVTPVSSVSSITPSPSSTSVYEPERQRNTQFHTREYQLRDSQKSKYVTGLVDQAVGSICDIWNPQDIPFVFLTSSRPTVATASTDSIIASLPSISLHGRNTQLPSPISPTTQSSPTPAPCIPNSYSPEIPLTPESRDQAPRCDIAPMKGFVHEVLRRSRTSGTVLQTALCYLEAIRAKIPELVSQEKGHPGSTCEKESVERIVQSEVSPSCAGLDGPTSSPETSAGNGLLDTIRINPITLEADSIFAEPVLGSRQGLPLPPLPSPLLCPRRTFLASLILASKFMQDRCYSNRAWAKLSGLPPREIGRCERALGEALEWRLWVGKLPAAPVASGRALTKCKSESNILLRSSPISQSVMETSPAVSPISVGSPLVARHRAGLRRHATLPVHSFYREDSYPATISSAVETSRWMPTESSLAMDTSPNDTEISPPTPGLSYSPTPTESSLGDRTIQMSSFMDMSTPPPPSGQFAAFSSAQNDKILQPVPIPFMYLTPNNVCRSHVEDQPYFATGISASHNESWPSVYAF